MQNLISPTTINTYPGTTVPRNAVMVLLQSTPNRIGKVNPLGSKLAQAWIKSDEEYKRTMGRQMEIIDLKLAMPTVVFTRHLRALKQEEWDQLTPEQKEFFA